MKGNTLKLSGFERFYYTVSEPARLHFKKQWYKVTGKTEATFHNRIKRPMIMDLALFQFCFDESPFAPLLVNKEIELHFLPEFKEVEKFKPAE